MASTRVDGEETTPSKQRKIPFPRKKPLVGSPGTRESKRSAESGPPETRGTDGKRRKGSWEGDRTASGSEDGPSTSYCEETTCWRSLPKVFEFKLGGKGWENGLAWRTRKGRKDARTERLGWHGSERWPSQALDIYLASNDMYQKRKTILEANLKRDMAVVSTNEGTLVQDLPMRMMLRDEQGTYEQTLHHVRFRGMWKYVVHAGQAPEGVPDLPLQPLQVQKANRQRGHGLGEIRIPHQCQSLLLELDAAGCSGVGAHKYKFSEFQTKKVKDGGNRGILAAFEGQETTNPDLRVVMEIKDTGSATHVGVCSVVLVWRSSFAKR